MNKPTLSFSQFCLLISAELARTSLSSTSRQCCLLSTFTINERACFLVSAMKVWGRWECDAHPAPAPALQWFGDAHVGSTGQYRALRSLCTQTTESTDSTEDRTDPAAVFTEHQNIWWPEILHRLFSLSAHVRWTSWSADTKAAVTDNLIIAHTPVRKPTCDMFASNGSKFTTNTFPKGLWLTISCCALSSDRWELPVLLYCFYLSTAHLLKAYKLSDLSHTRTALKLFFQSTKLVVLISAGRKRYFNPLL